MSASSLESEYIMRTPNSKRLFELSAKTTPGGVSSNPRFYPPYPIFIKKGAGARIYDVDDNEYVDYQLGLGPLVLGHAHPAIVEAVKDQLYLGSQLVPANESEIKLAQTIVQNVPCAEMIRFTNSGTEAVLYTIRLARAVTGKKKIVKFEGAYHGHLDEVYLSVSPPLSAAGPREKPKSVPVSAGIPEEIVNSCIILPFNDEGILEQTLEEQGDSIAAVITEPFMRSIPPKPGFLSKLRKLTKANGVKLIFDEVVTGFRSSPGGAQEYYGVKADIVALGKIIGGGFPIGAFAADKEMMSLLDPRRKEPDMRVVHAGTYAANPISTVAGLAMIHELINGNYSKLKKVGEKVTKGLRDAADDNHLASQVILGPGAIFNIYFTNKEIYDYRSAVMNNNKELTTNFHMGLYLNGVNTVFAQKFYSSAVHTDEDISKTVEAFYKSMRKVAKK